VIDLPLASSSEDALEQPTRARLFELLGELKRPAGTVELAERFSLHPNGVRAHLEPAAKLAGFVPRDPDKAGRLGELSGIHDAPDAR
jgi:hypothetical protein